MYCHVAVSSNLYQHLRNGIEKLLFETYFCELYHGMFHTLCLVQCQARIC